LVGAMCLWIVKTKNYPCPPLLVAVILPHLIVVHGLALDTENTWLGVNKWL